MYSGWFFEGRDTVQHLEKDFLGGRDKVLTSVCVWWGGGGYYWCLEDPGSLFS